MEWAFPAFLHQPYYQKVMLWAGGDDGAEHNSALPSHMSSKVEDGEMGVIQMPGNNSRTDILPTNAVTDHNYHPIIAATDEEAKQSHE